MVHETSSTLVANLTSLVTGDIGMKNTDAECRQIAYSVSWRHIGDML